MINSQSIIFQLRLTLEKLRTAITKQFHVTEIPQLDEVLRRLEEPAASPIVRLCVWTVRESHLTKNIPDVRDRVIFEMETNLKCKQSNPETELLAALLTACKTYLERKEENAGQET